MSYFSVNLELDIDVECDLPWEISGNADKVKEVVQDLISTAILRAVDNGILSEFTIDDKKIKSLQIERML